MPEEVQKLGRSSYAAAALVQAALNAMSTAAPRSTVAGVQPLDGLSPTTPLAAAMVLQVRVLAVRRGCTTATW